MTTTHDLDDDGECKVCGLPIPDECSGCEDDQPEGPTVLMEKLKFIASAWRGARINERDYAELMKVAMRAAATAGIPETQIATVAGVDRMTVRRALGKRYSNSKATVEA